MDVTADQRRSERSSPKLHVIYVAGPFRSRSTYDAGRQSAWGIHLHVTVAAAVALEIWRAGHVAICPHMNSYCFDGAAPDAVFLQGDLELVRRSDAIVMVNGWKESTGAKAEHDYAASLDLPIFYTLEGVMEWFRSGELAKALKLDAKYFDTGALGHGMRP